MMTDQRFNSLNLKEKTWWVHFKGEFVASIRYYQYKVNLYLIDGLYVELFYHHSQDRIERIDPLDHRSKRMNFYADQIALTDIYRNLG